MSKSVITDSVLTDIADAIRAKHEWAIHPMLPSSMAGLIASIPTGGISYQHIAERHYNLPIDVGGATQIKSYAFQGISSSESGGVSGAQVVTIGSSAFSQFPALTSADFPVCTTIYGNAFQGTNIVSADFPLVRSMPENSVFQGCASLVSANFPALTSVPGSCFRFCSSLANVNMPGVKTIGSMAFAGCTALTSIALPAAVTSITTNAFSGCTALTDIYVSWAEGAVSGAPWGATNATIHYNTQFDADGNVV